MPIDLSLYPPNWKELSTRVKKRAGWRCEWPGCEAPHDTVIIRYESNLEHWDRPSRVEDLRYKLARGIVRRVRVIITASHKCYCDPICGDDAHLWALCQLHHLRFDLRQRAIAAAGSRRAKDARRGQGFLFDDIDAESPRRAPRGRLEL